MPNKAFSKHAVKQFSHNPYVVKCTQKKIIFTEEFCNLVLEAVKNGEDPVQVFSDNGFTPKILGMSRINGTISLWKNRYGVTSPIRRKKGGTKPQKETAQERRDKKLQAAVIICDELIANPTKITKLPENPTEEDVLFFAINQVFEENKKNIVLKDLCNHYEFGYTEYYHYYNRYNKKEDTFVNVLSTHRKKTGKE